MPSVWSGRWRYARLPSSANMAPCGSSTCAIGDFQTVARLAGIELANGAIAIENLSAPRVPPTGLPVGKMAV
jgi:hypothetical protein